MSALFVRLLVVLAALALAASEVLYLSEHDFSAMHDGSSNLLVEFFAPW